MRGKGLPLMTRCLFAAVKQECGTVLIQHVPIIPPSHWKLCSRDIMSLMLVLLPSDASRSYIDPRCVIDISYESAGNEMLNAATLEQCRAYIYNIMLL